MNSQNKKELKLQTYNINSFFKEKEHFEIPLYQRAYSWDAENVIPLIEDVIERAEDGDQHFFGILAISRYSTVAGKDKTINRVIDGQQRITTSIIFIDYLMEKIHKLDPSLGQAPGGFKTIFNNTTFENEIKTEESTSIASITKGPSIRVMKGNVLKVYNIIDEYFKGENFKDIKPTLEKYELWLKAFKEKFTLGVLLYEIEKDKEMLVFENLNSKGSPLSEYDLIKNYMISMKEERDPKTKLQFLNKKITNLLTSGSYKLGGDAARSKIMNSFVDAYLKWKISSIKSYSIKSYKNYKLYKNFKEYVQKQNIEFNDLIEDMHKFLSLYLSTTHKNGVLKRNLWISAFDSKDIQIPFIFELFNNESSYDGNEWAMNKSIEEYLKVFSCHIIKLISVEGTGQSLGGLTLEIIKYYKKGMSPKEIQEELYSLNRNSTPTDELFFDALKSRMPKKWISNIIINILTNASMVNEKVDYVNSKTLEHIMPQTPTKKHWPIILDDDFKDKQKIYLHQIGNLCLFDKNSNSSLGNIAFDSKKIEYRKSISPLIVGSLNIPKITPITQYDQWNFDSIETRTKQLAIFALEVMRIK